jgi:hypothetical protein
MKVPKYKGISQDVTIKRTTEGHNDANLQWVEGGEVLIATAIGVTLYPMTGKDRSDPRQGGYTSDYVLYAGTDDLVFETGYLDIEDGDFVYDAAGKRYKVIFPGLFPGSHYEAELFYFPITKAQI